MFDNSDRSENNYPELTDSLTVFLDTYQGILEVDMELCLKIANNEHDGHKAGTCGYCGDGAQIYEFKKYGKEYIFIYLCECCKSTLQSDLIQLLENNSSELTSNLI